jgi:hypothetical protein
MTVEASTREWSGVDSHSPAVLPHTPDPAQVARLPKA